MKRGRVIFFDEKNKFGFIKSNDSDLQYYVHAKNLEETIMQGNEVEFEVAESKRGLKAIKVKKTKM